MVESRKSNTAKISKGTWVLFGSLGAMLLASALGLWFALNHGAMAKISVHGWIAMTIGVVFSLAIGCGLMWLSFYSAKQGFDDRADPGRLTSRNDTKSD